MFLSLSKVSSLVMLSLEMVSILGSINLKRHVGNWLRQQLGAQVSSDGTEITFVAA